MYDDCMMICSFKKFDLLYNYCSLHNIHFFRYFLDTPLLNIEKGCCVQKKGAQHIPLSFS